MMSPQGVILLHGIFRTDRSMRKMETFLQSHGYRVLNISYPSTKASIEQIIELIHPQINAFAQELNGPISFVGYSMGGLIIRAYLHKYRPENLFRVVMLGTPNNGCELADLFGNWRLYKKYYGPAGQQLGTAQDDFRHLFGNTDYELGVIAGNWTIDPISSLIIKGSNDGKVSVASTKLDGMTDHVVLPIAHTFFPVSRRVMAKTLAFLQNGRF